MSNVQMRNEGKCSRCGTWLEPYAMFCSECQSITPRGRENVQQLQDYTCTCCGVYLHPHAVFCPECQRLSPRAQLISETYAEYTKKQLTAKWRAGFLVQADHRKCPHCKQEETIVDLQKIGSPIVNCPSCHDFFIDDSKFEWSVAPDHSRFWFSFFSGSITVGMLIITACQAMLYPWLALLTASIYFLVRFLWIKSRNPLIDASYKRLKRNPDYTNILQQMNYYYLSPDNIRKDRNTNTTR